jgi:hypothetical protein
MSSSNIIELRNWIGTQPPNGRAARTKPKSPDEPHERRPTGPRVRRRNRMER